MAEAKYVVTPSRTRATPTIALPRGCRKREQWLEHLIKAHGWIVGAELGVWQGRTFLHLLATCPQLQTLYGVDLWEPQPDNGGPQNYTDWPHHQYERRVREGAQRYGSRGVIMKMWTHEAAIKIPDNSLDFVFVDADHSEGGVRRDLQCWLPKVKDTGWVLGHDINWPTVLIAIEELIPGYIVGPDNTWGRPKTDIDAGIRHYLAQKGVAITRRKKTLGDRIAQLLRLNKHRRPDRSG